MLISTVNPQQGYKALSVPKLFVQETSFVEHLQELELTACNLRNAGLVKWNQSVYPTKSFIGRQQNTEETEDQLFLLKSFSSSREDSF